MTDDHFPPERDYLPGDTAPPAEYCGECDRHVVSDHDHAEDCSQWRGNQDPDEDRR